MFFSSKLLKSTRLRVYFVFWQTRLFCRAWLTNTQLNAGIFFFFEGPEDYKNRKTVKHSCSALRLSLLERNLTAPGEFYGLYWKISRFYRNTFCTAPLPQWARKPVDIIQSSTHSAKRFLYLRILKIWKSFFDIKENQLIFFF